MSLTPKRCLQNMAAALADMQDAQRRCADLSARYPGPDVSMDDVRLAQGDTGYYAAQAQTWAAAATALLTALDRYQPRVADDDSFRDCHAAVPRADEVELIKVGTR